MKEELIIDYDKDADVLYLNFYNPPFEATDSHSVGNIILRYKWGELIGVTIIDISKLLDFSPTNTKEAKET